MNYQPFHCSTSQNHIRFLKNQPCIEHVQSTENATSAFQEFETDLNEMAFNYLGPAQV